jgi:hypothetical protein
MTNDLSAHMSVVCEPDLPAWLTDTKRAIEGTFEAS